MKPLQKSLWTEFSKRMLVSVVIFVALFLILYMVEWMFPSVEGMLLQWNNPAFVVGIPASVIGVGYVLTIQNPKNYIGFYGGIIMSLLLAWQFMLLQEWSLTILYIVVFVPFMIFSMVSWRKKTVQSVGDDKKSFPTWLTSKDQLRNLLILIGIVALDSGLITDFKVIVQADGLLLQIMSSLMIGSSILANYWLIYQKIDAWLWWVVYSLAGMVLYALIGNAFSFVLFTVFLIVNTGAGIAWIKFRKKNIK